MEKLKIRLKRREQEVETEDGSVLILRELSGKERNGFLEQFMECAEISKDGQSVEIKDASKMPALQVGLLSASMHQNGELVSAEEIESWPSTTLTELFQAAQELNGFGQAAEELGNA